MSYSKYGIQAVVPPTLIFSHPAATSEAGPVPVPLANAVRFAEELFPMPVVSPRAIPVSEPVGVLPWMVRGPGRIRLPPCVNDPQS